MNRRYIFAIDPGNEKSAYALICMDNGLRLYDFGIVENDCMKEKMKIILKDVDYYPAIEMIASYGMAVGKTVFDTCVWIGRFQEQFLKISDYSKSIYIYRKDEKMNLCGSMKAKDSNIRQALIDRFAKHDFKNGRGLKANPDIFYGVSKDVWSAIAVGVTYHDLNLYN